MSKLISFHSTPLTEALKISATSLRLTPQVIELEFRLEGALQSIRWGDSNSTLPQRKDELWKGTCFEAFLSLSTDPSEPYYEINCSPHGDWNIYHFDSYRQGMIAAPDLQVELVKQAILPERAVFAIQIRGPLPTDPLLTGLTAVVQFLDSTVSYWALQHSQKKADFHDKTTFIAKT